MTPLQSFYNLGLFAILPEFIDFSGTLSLSRLPFQGPTSGQGWQTSGGGIPKDNTMTVKVAPVVVEAGRTAGVGDTKALGFKGVTALEKALKAKAKCPLSKVLPLARRLL